LAAEEQGKRLGQNVEALRERLKKRIEGKVTPEVLNAILLDEMTGRLEDIAGLLEKANDRAYEQGEVLERILTQMTRKPEGVSDSWNVAVTDMIKPLIFTQPFQSVDVHNDGPNNIRYAVNKQSLGTAELVPGEWKIIDLHDAKINNMNFQCAPGETANLRVFAVR